MRAQRTVVGVHRPGEPVGLQRQDRKDARHRVEQHTRRGTPAAAPRAGRARPPVKAAPGRPSGVPPLPGGRTVRHLERAAAGQRHHPRQPQRRRRRLRRGLRPQPDPARALGDALHRGDAREPLRDEHVAVAEALGSRHRFAPPSARPRTAAPGRRSWCAGGRCGSPRLRHPRHAGRRGVEQRRTRCVRLPRTDAEHPGELEARRDALDLADQHVRGGHHGERGLHVRSCLRGGEQHHLTAVPVADDGAVGAPMHLGRRPGLAGPLRPVARPTPPRSASPASPGFLQ